MIPFNFRIEILPIRALLCAMGSKGLSMCVHRVREALDSFISLGKQI